jgi:hypothetical protein
VSNDEIELRSPLPEDLRSALVRAAEGAVLPDDPDPLETLGFYRVEA